MRRTQVLLTALLALAGSVLADNIKLQQVDRKISLNSQFVRISETVKVKNVGSSAVSEVILCESLGGDAVLSFYKVVETSSKHALAVSPTTVADAPAEVACYSVKLANPLPAGETVGLTVTAVLANAQMPYPAEITQTDTQLMLYKGNVYVLSPYSVSSQTTEVALPSSTVKSYTEEKPVSKVDNKIKYGKYDLVKPFAVKELSVHFENNKPFKHVLTYVKEIEVSHWGNIYVEGKYEIKNAGAKHTGSFSRLKYGHMYNGKANSFRDLRAVLPSSAHSMYYVDLIGNISTSNVRKSLASTVLDFDLRYPLMGGWKVDFTIGYSVPLAGFLTSTKGGQRRLTMDLSSPLEDVFIEDMVVRVVLPEGSANIKASLPYDMEQSFDIKYTYLDTTGRPVLVLHKQNIAAPEHAAKFSVDYDFNKVHILREPLLLVGVFFALFVAVIAYNRMEFTITRDEKWEAARSKEVLATYMEQIQALLEDEATVLAGLTRATNQVRDAADVDAAQREKANVEKRLKDLEEKVKPLLLAVESRSVRVAAQVRDVLEKTRSLQGRYYKQLADRIDLVKKGTGMSEVSRKLAPGQDALNAAKRELEGLTTTVFGAY
ncbi:hypothetical protein VOLCADRAFT_103748 [Volvox carteri f. nagariensis]|uniref:Dolichyl-diphosphooligosaccharide--protein glycosyltransferase subunit 1 n=1 Tax=Volvox carteri f. nagariensis TaxID=3068 RepID=D8TN99_VOLCA|nr:uncharacterized protein VOLCADRAFT_103748 [Volvox carteri f. nagariensis]EFJ50952.1 hypothetical protein VOLCADRAFT_103748 [Volvox carteri f. nagariensis]|eukprot:XP_002947964.1 hypothetical protein VOLCADRAFT_103748 [Volvox carteri f. nagariensis]